jgi:ABC-2 type transport system permease protein
MIRFLLSLFMPFRWFIEKMGADYTQFIRILRLKLTMDDRRLKGLGNNSKKSTENALMKQSFSQIFFGIFFAIFLLLVKSPFTYYYFAHTFVMVMMAMMIISEFTTVLFDTSENVIIQPLPIKGNTISLARNAHVFLYLTMMAFNLSIISIILAMFKFGIVSGLIFLLSIFLNVLFTLFLANVLYLGIMRLASGEKLKNLLMYFQIVIAILFMSAYQFGLNMVDKTKIQDMILPVHWYTYLAPPAFFSGLVEALSTWLFDLQHLIFIAEALIIPPLAIFLTGKYLTPVFNRKLMDLEQGDRVSKVRIETSHNSLYFKMMSWIFIRRQEEKAPFKLMWKMTGRERLFKQTFLPSLGYIVIMIVVPFFTKSFNYNELIESDRYLLVLYIFIFVGATLPSAMLVGNNQHATWIFKTVPLSTPAPYFKGFIKAAFARFFMPFYLILTITLCSIWGIKVLPDVAIALMAIYLFTLVFYYSQGPNLPFASEKMAGQGGTVFMKILALMATAIALGFLHQFLLHWFNFANLILLPIYSGAIFYVNRIFVYTKITWQALDRVNNYS